VRVPTFHLAAHARTEGSLPEPSRGSSRSMFSMISMMLDTEQQ
jgi:hypothetical protein